MRRPGIALGSVLAVTAACVAIACFDTSSLSDPPPDGGTGEAGDAGVPDAAADAGTDAADASDGAPTSRYARAVLADGPIAYFRLGDAQPPASGPKPRLVDLIRSDRITAVHGTPTFGVPGALLGDPDTAIAFSSSNVTLGEDFGFAGNAPFTIELWLEPASLGFGHVFTKQDRDITATKHGYAVYYNNSACQFERYVDGTDVQATSGVAPVGTFTYVVAIYDGTALSLYIDGASTGAGKTDGRVLPNPASPPVIAASTISTDDGFDGVIDELAIYDRPLTVAQITTHFAAAR